MNAIDAFLNSVTMYRLVLGCLAALAAVAVVWGFAGFLGYGGSELIASLLVLLIACVAANRVFGRIFRVPTNIESVAVTALILFFVMAPPEHASDALLLAVVGIFAMASKYLIAIRGKHIFNPAAIAALTFGTFTGSATWWVGNPYLLLPALIAGFFVVRKIRRFAMVGMFLAAAFATALFFGMRAGVAPGAILLQATLSWPLVFFASIMLTEPLTTPPTRRLQLSYGAIVGALFGSPFSVGPLYASPELALVIGNASSFLAGSRDRMWLTLRETRAIASGIREFVFASPRKIAFASGQYLEWTLPHEHPDSRGNRRFFTIASSPTESEIRLGVRASDHPSSFKRRLLELALGDRVIAGHVSGDFTLPRDPSEKLVWIAGGIGVTPFRSMAKYLFDRKERRDIIFFYANKTPEDIAWREFFDSAASAIGLRAIHVISDPQRVPEGWDGETGFLTPEMVLRRVPDYCERMYYLSGPNAMVTAYRKLFLGMGISRRRIVTDYFPGFA